MPVRNELLQVPAWRHSNSDLQPQKNCVSCIVVSVIFLGSCSGATHTDVDTWPGDLSVLIQQLFTSIWTCTCKSALPDVNRTSQ